jgi:hypothetical protein
MINKILKPTFTIVGALNFLYGFLVAFNIFDPTKFLIVANYFALGLIMLSFGLFGTFENRK